MNLRHYFRRSLRAIFLLTFLVGFIGGVNGEGTIVDDFNDCNDDGWTQKIHRIGGQDRNGGTWDATFVHDGSCAYRLATALGSASIIGAGWEGPSDTDFSDGFFRATVRPESQDTAVVMAMRGVVGGDGYLGEFRLNRGIMLIRNHGVAGTMFETGLDIQADEDWFMQIGTVGEQFSLKAWQVNEPEPPSPQLTATYSTRTTGVLALATGLPPGAPRGIGSTIFDDIHFFPAGDFDRNGELDFNDIDMLTSEIAIGTHDVHFDVTGDNLVNGDDHTVWVKDFKKTWFGDANLDGEFSTTDLIDVFQVGSYEKDVDVGWNGGDWTGDNRFDTTDLVKAFQDGGFEQGPLADLAAVPEPNTLFIASMAVTGLLAFCRH